MYSQYLGMPIYQSSFDAYAFMIILMCERAFYSTVMNNENLYLFFKNMFTSDSDFNIVKNRLIQYHDILHTITTKDIFIILSDINLRCDMINFGWENLKKMKM